MKRDMFLQIFKLLGDVPNHDLEDRRRQCYNTRDLYSKIALVNTIVNLLKKRKAFTC